MIYYLPTVQSNRQGFEALGQLAAETEGLSADRLELDMSRVQQCDGNMAAPLGAVLARVADNLNTIEIVGLRENVERVLRKNGFLTYFRYAPMDDTTRTSMLYRRFQLEDEGLFEDYIVRSFRGKPVPIMSEAMRRLFKNKIFEVFQNAVMHSDSILGVFSCGQFFPRAQKLDLTIADVGIGIRNCVRTYSGLNITSIGALRWALAPGHTTKRAEQPGGLGLKLLHDFASKNRGRILIASRYGYYEFDGGEQTFQKMEADFPGTAVTIEINTADTAAYCLASEITPDNVF